MHVYMGSSKVNGQTVGPGVFSRHICKGHMSNYADHGKFACLPTLNNEVPLMILDHGQNS